MTESEGRPREELYRNWHAWVTSNLGHDGTRATIAANAATDAALQGSGFNGAAKAAKTAWEDADRQTSKEAMSPRRPRGGRALRNIRITAAVLVTIAICAFLVTHIHRPVSRSQAIEYASRTTGVHRVDRSAAKLMTWQDFQAGSGWVAPGVCCWSPPGDSQPVWVVALAGDIRIADNPELQQRSEIVVLSADSGEVITFDGGGGFKPVWPNDWPPYWDRLPDTGGAG